MVNGKWHKRITNTCSVFQMQLMPYHAYRELEQDYSKYSASMHNFMSFPLSEHSTQPFMKKVNHFHGNCIDFIHFFSMTRVFFFK